MSTPIVPWRVSKLTRPSPGLSQNFSSVVVVKEWIAGIWALRATGSVPPPGSRPGMSLPSGPITMQAP